MRTHIQYYDVYIHTLCSYLWPVDQHYYIEACLQSAPVQHLQVFFFFVSLAIIVMLNLLIAM